VDDAAARRALGVGANATWDEVRAAYRAAIRGAHPDSGGSTRQAATLNIAYATLVRSRRAAPPGTTGATPAPSPGPQRPPPPPGPVEVLDGDTLLLPVPPGEAFALVVDACHRIGDVTYVDRSCAILETLVAVPDEGACSLVVTLQGRAHGTEAFCTLEAIEHVASPPVAPVVAALRTALAHWAHG
jgi:hypothetical protein